MKIILTKTFYFYINKYRINKDILVKEYIKIKNSWKCMNIWTYDNFEICKWYLLWKEKRLITLIEKDNFIIPIIILKKESKKGNNINKNNVMKDFLTNFEKVFFDLNNNNIQEIIDI